MIRRVRRFFRYARLVLGVERGQKFISKLDQWDGSSWALAEIKAGNLHYVVFTLETSDPGLDEYSCQLLTGRLGDPGRYDDAPRSSRLR